MPYTIKVDTERKLVLMTWRGDIEERKAFEALQKFAATPGFDPSFPTLVDLRYAKFRQPLITTQELAKQQATLYPNRGPLAVVVSDDLSFGAVSQYAAFSDMRGRAVRVFRDIIEAEVWLGLKPPNSKRSSGGLAC